MSDTDLSSKAKNRNVKSWIILAVAALNVIFLGGKRRAFGIFVAEFHNGDFKNVSLAELNWISDSYAAVGHLTTTLSTAIILHFERRFKTFQFIGASLILIACLTSSIANNAHWLFLTHTVFHGIGSSLILSTVGLVVNEHFDQNHKYHILATTLVSGGSIASILFVQFYAFLIDRFGWRHAFLILGINYFFINCLGSCTFSKVKNLSISHKKNKLTMNWKENITRRHIPLIVLWTFDRILTTIVVYGVLLNLADYLRRSEKSLSNSTSLTVLFASGEASTYLIGAIITALTKNFFKNRLKYILLVCTGLMSFSLIIWEFMAKIRSISNILAFMSGFFLGPSITFLYPAGEEMTQLPGHLAYPFSLGGMGIGMILSPFLSAVIATAFDYQGFFFVQGCLMFLKFLCLFILCIFTREKMQSSSVEYHRLSLSEKEDNEDLNNETSDPKSLLDRKIYNNINIKVK